MEKEYISEHEFEVVEPYQTSEVLPSDCTKHGIGLGVQPNEVNLV